MHAISLKSEQNILLDYLSKIYRMLNLRMLVMRIALKK